MPLPALMRFFPESPLRPVDSFLSQGNEGISEGEKSYSVADVLAAKGVPFVFATAYHKNNPPISYQRFPLLQKPYSQLTWGDMLMNLLTKKEADA
jgi:hypothetical protein